MRLVLRLRTAPEGRMVPGRRPNQRLALGSAVFLGGSAVAGFLLCVWRWGLQFRMVDTFPFSQGFFSHWQTWFAAGLLLQALSTMLSNYARRPSVEPAVGRRPLRKRRT